MQTRVSVKKSEFPVGVRYLCPWVYNGCKVYMDDEFQYQKAIMID